MDAFGELFHSDATFVNRFGHYVKGVNEIIEMHITLHKTIYRDSTIKNELIDIIPWSEEIMITHFWSRLSAGDAHPIGPHNVDTVIMAVLVKQNEEWRIRVLENVTLVNPRTGHIKLRNVE
nr:SgcJ/EcaC family oxidoreductase [Providencia alcalifaciens]